MNPEPPRPPPKVEEAPPPTKQVVVPEGLTPDETNVLQPGGQAGNVAAAAALTEGEEKQIERDQRRDLVHESIQEKKLRNKSLEEDITARRKYALAIFVLIVAWLVAVFTMLLLQGFLSKREIAVNVLFCRLIYRTAIHFELSDGVLLALIGGTTATVIGLFAIVANYFFPKKSN
jgi:hypothetical protein